MTQTDRVPAVETEPYVLDIDLDYFHSEDAIEPGDAATFYRLVRNAVAVTRSLLTFWTAAAKDNR